MRNVFIAVALAVCSVTASAQNGGNVLYSHLDLPTENQVLSRADLTLHGWAFNCTKGGQQPFNVKVSLLTGTELIDVPVQRYSAIYRPDVKAAFEGRRCPEMSSYTGFALVPVNWESLPTGTFTLVVEHSDSNGAAYSQMRVTLVP